MEDIISAAALPLGITNRVLIAAALALIGGLIGLIVSRLFPGAAARRRDSRAQEQVRRPFSASELAEEPLGDFAMRPLEPVREDDTAALFDAPAVAPLPLIDIAPLQLALRSESLLPEPEPADVIIDAPVETNSVRPAKLGKAAQRLLAAELATLTPIELVERLGISMQLQRASTPVGAEPTPRPRPAVPITRLQPAPPARADNEQVLRSALAALQRLSGAA